MDVLDLFCAVEHEYPHGCLFHDGGWNDLLDSLDLIGEAVRWYGRLVTTEGVRDVD
jgi:hypothetical protein